MTGDQYKPGTAIEAQVYSGKKVTVQLDPDTNRRGSIRPPGCNYVITGDVNYGAVGAEHFPLFSHDRQFYFQMALHWGRKAYPA